MTASDKSSSWKQTGSGGAGGPISVEGDHDGTWARRFAAARAFLAYSRPSAADEGPAALASWLRCHTGQALIAAVDAVAGLAPSTPSSHWRADGNADPHGDRYDCERAKLAHGHMTDDELANAVFMHGGDRLDLAAIQRGEPSSISLLTAAKDRIRWLSRQLEAVKAGSAEAQS